MNFVAKLGLGLFGVVVGSYGLASADLGSSPRQDMIDASVQIGNYCSGTVIEDPNPKDGEQVTIITAKHCVKAIGEKVIINVNFADPLSTEPIRTVKPFVFRVVDMGGEGIDLALLQMTDLNQVKDWKVKPASIAHRPVYEGEKVTVIGYPRGLYRVITEGFASLPFDIGYDFGVVQVMGVLISPGNSGGGVFNEENELVGVTTLAYGRSFDYLSGATLYSEIKTFLGEGNGG